MDDKDHVFARFKDDRPEAPDRREVLTIPRRAGASGSRMVEVVHLRSGAAAKDKPRRFDTHVRAASWEGGFPARQAVAVPAAPEPVFVDPPKPTAHVMPAWGPVPAEAKPQPAAHAPEATPETAAVAPARRGRPRRDKAIAPARRIADPFDANDDGANCIRCGYAIEPARGSRGLMTCSACG